MRPSGREAVYAAIDEERNYQDNLGNDRTDGSFRTVGDYLTMMGTYYRRAVDDWTNNPGNEQALDEIRKIAAIGVRALEEHGVVRRKT